MVTNQLTKKEREENKERFIGLIRSINREGAKVEELLIKLENSDFYIAPASTKYHGSYEGGLVHHCLAVYDNLKLLIEMKGIKGISEDCIIILALLHDFSKMNLYKREYRNKKVYSPDGSKSDNAGRFEWVAEEIYAMYPLDERFLYGNHEETAEFMIRQYIPLTYQESVAIINHHAGMSYDSHDLSSSIIERFPVATLLHLADMLACNIDKR